MQDKTYKDRSFAQEGLSFSSRIAALKIGLVLLFVCIALPYHVFLVSKEDQPPPVRSGNAEHAHLQYKDACGIYTDHLRGSILDRNGKLLATSRLSYNLGIKAANLPQAQAAHLAERLSLMVQGIDKRKTEDILRKSEGLYILKTRAP